MTVSLIFYKFLRLVFFNLGGSMKPSLRKQPSFFAPGPSGVSRKGLGPGAKKDGCFRRLYETPRTTPSP